MLSPGLGGSEPFNRSFNFSEFPNLQELDFWVGWMSGGLPWIPAALSTLKSATSPHLSAIRLSFLRASPPIWPADTSVERTSGDLQRVAGEVARIESEFGGAVNLTVFRDESFAVVLDTLKVRFLLAVFRNFVDFFHPFLADPSTSWPLRWVRG